MSPFPAFPSVCGEAGDERRAAAALHEAGHAVIAALDGCGVASVQIKPVGAEGSTIISARPAWQSPLLAATAAARMAAAGYAAVMAFGPPHWLEYEGPDDRAELGIHCKTIAELTGIDAFEACHVIGHSAGVDIGLNAMHIRALSAYLQRRGTVQGHKLRRMLPAPCAVTLAPSQIHGL